MNGNFMIGVDCEGPACVVGEPGSTLTQCRQFDFARRQATREANAAATALFEAGAQRVVVWDNHGGSLNLDYDALDTRCEIAAGRFDHRWPGLDESFAGVLFIGYHAMAGTARAPLAHTMSSREFQWIKVNGREVGEMAIDAARAGLVGVPPIFAASDDKAVAEAQAFFPGIETVQTKVGFGNNAAVSMHPQRSCEQIAQAVARAVRRLDQASPFTFASPLTCEIRYNRLFDVETKLRNSPGWRQVDARTLAITVDSIGDLW